MKLQTNELKRCQKRTLTKVLKTRKVSIQAGQLDLHYVPGKHGLNSASLQRPRRNPLNASGIACGLFYGAKFENATINVNFSS